MKKFQYVLIAACLTIFSCSVVEDGVEPEEMVVDFDNAFPSNSADVNNYLRSLNGKSWRATQFTIASMDGFQACRLDDVITLNSDFTYDYDGGTLLCGAEDNQKIKSGTWTIDNDTRMMQFDKGSDHEVEVYIESLTETELVYSTSYLGLAILGKMVQL
jgi:hypothetical protein